MFTDYPDFLNSGCPDAQLCTENVTSKTILHKYIFVLYFKCLFREFYFPILKAEQAVSTLLASHGSWR